MDSPHIAGVGSAFPRHYYDQDTLIAALKDAWGRHHYNSERLDAIHRNVLVGGRHLALPLEEYRTLTSWGAANRAWLRVAREVGEVAVREALRVSGVDPGDVDAFLFATVTGISTPSLDALLMNQLRLPARVKRTPIFGLGCVAGAAGIARAADYLAGHPDDVTVVLSVELCSLTLQQDDLSIPNVIATGLFGDGAAAAVLTGAGLGTSGPSVVATRAIFYPDSERVMGWDVADSGFRIVLSADVPNVVLEHTARDVDTFLCEHGLTRHDIARWVSHPGGPKVLAAMQQALGLPDEALEASWRTLREAGNLSSASVLLVLQDVMARPPDRGDYGLMIAMGPGFCSELVLLRW